MKPVLSVQNVHKSFGGHSALSGVSLNLYPGEVHTLMGENGAGKSTLIKVITGIHARDEGRIELSGQNISARSNHEAQKYGISTVYQEVNLAPNLSVAENIFIGREPTRFKKIDWKNVREGAKLALKKLDIEIDIDRNLEEFPIAIQQMVAIARSLDMSAKVLILDEATSSLDAKEVDRLFVVLEKLKAQGLAILFVSHFLDQVFRISDRITVLRNGKFITEKKISEITQTQLVSQMMGQELEGFEQNPTQKQESTSPAWLKCKKLSNSPKLKAFDLEVRNGETIGLAGLLGSGRTEIAHLLFGIDAPTGGNLEIDGRNQSFKSPRESIKNGFALCPEDRKHQSIFQGLSLKKNLLIALRARLGWFQKLSEERELVEYYVKALGIRAKDIEQSIETLSGGNQQKVILGRWLATDPRLLILDEPTRGIDVGAKAEIQKYIAALPKENRSIIFISSELEEVVRNCDRVVVLKDREKVAELNADQISQASIVSAIGGS